MIQLMLLIISYGALMLLLMPASVVGIISMAVILALGIGLIAYKKVYKIAFWKNPRYLLIPVAFFVALYLGREFYFLWLYSSKLQLIASIFHLPFETTLLVGTLTLCVLAAYFIYAVLQIALNKLSKEAPHNIFAMNLVYCVVAALITVITSQVIVEAKVFSMGLINLIFCVLIVSVVILFIYCLLGRVIPSILIGSGIFVIFSVISSYVLKFRGRMFEPADIFSVGTAMNVADNYSLWPIPHCLILGLGFVVGMLIFVNCIKHKVEPGLSAKRRLVILAVCIISSVAIFLYASNLKTYNWRADGATYYGYVLNFASKFKNVFPSEPDNYSVELVTEVAERYDTDANEYESEKPKQPHIIVIMDETYSDLGVIGEFSTNMEVAPFISSLKENAISGYSLVSVYGGNTANSEYEFLTGNTMAWLSPNVVPYQQYIRASTYSMVSYLKSEYNYKCVAMHPYASSGWGRPAAYDRLAFDECFFIEDFPNMNYIRGYISDQEMFEFLIETYEAQKENPLFIFGVTMQNHGGYTYTGDNFTKHISLTDYGDEFSEVEQYLSLLHETDKAVENLITYFQNVDEDVVIVFFGDHQPKIDQSFYETVSGVQPDTLDEQQKRYVVPFFVWANYDIEEEYVECTSLNYLANYMYDVAGIDLPPYNLFLQEMEDIVPSINAYGFYSLDKGRYLPFDEADGEALKWLEVYEVLQYNSIFDRDNLNKTLFPPLA